MNTELTKRQEKVLKMVDGFVREHGFPPTLREIGQVLSLPNVNAVRGHLTALEKKGYIVRDADKARCIHLVHSPSALSRLKKKLHDLARTDEGVIHRVVYALAWATWGRRPLLTGARRDRISQALRREAVEHGWRLLSESIQPDHVVLVVEVWPNHSAQQTVGRFLAAGRAVRRSRPKDFPGRRLWESAYAVTTDLELLDDLVREFLRNVGKDDHQERERP